MSEDLVVNLFLWVRVTLVGGLLLLFPRIARKGLFFGVYVGEEFADSHEGHRVLGSWNKGILLVMAVSILIGLAFTLGGQAVAGNLTGTAFLLLVPVWLYLEAHSKVRSLAPPTASRQAEIRTATLLSESPRGEALAIFSLALCALTAVITFFYALVSFRSMPDLIPSLSNPFQLANGLASKSARRFLLAPSLNLLLPPLFAVGAWVTSGAKLSIREGGAKGSAEAQLAFRSLTSKILSGTALLVSAILTLYSVQIVRMGLGDTRSMGFGAWLLPGAFLLFALGSLFRILRRTGQGGALLERGSDTGPLTGALADNTHWVLGLFYVNRDDPSMYIENRFGIGYSLNYGNPLSLILAGAFTGVFLSVVGLLIVLL